jgi:hypothetical protein
LYLLLGGELWAERATAPAGSPNFRLIITSAQVQGTIFATGQAREHPRIAAITRGKLDRVNEYYYYYYYYYYYMN